MRMTDSGQSGDNEGEEGKGSVEEGAVELGFQRGERVQQGEDGPSGRGNTNEIAMRYRSVQATGTKFTKQFPPDLCNSSVFTLSRDVPFFMV